MKWPWRLGAAMKWPWRRGGQPDANPAASMALLQEVLDRPLDPGYESAAQTRRERGLAASTGSRTVLLVVTSVLLGFLMTVAAIQLRAPDPATAEARAELMERVRAASALGDAHAEHIEVLRAEVGGLEQAALEKATTEGEDDPAAEELRRASVGAGSTAMVGPGVRVVLDDAPVPENDPQAPATSNNRVLSHDLQVLVNGLWSAGAEAMSINGQRLTSTSSIRFAGEAIVVDFRGLNRPYEVVAIGPPDLMTDELTTRATGAYLADLRDTYGILASVVAEDEVTVPAGTRVSTRVAEVVPTTQDGVVPTTQQEEDEP